MSFVRHLLDLLSEKPGPITFLLMLKVTAVMFTFTVVRSLTITAAGYVLFWRLWKNRYAHRRIQRDIPNASQMWREFRWSLLTFAIYAVLGSGMYLLYRAGWTQYYPRISDRGWPYFLLSIVLMALLHDAYFYWTHRLLHTRWMFRHAHRVHHESRNPSPWSAFAFHPTEAAITFGIIPLIIIVMPYHVGAVAIFLLYMTGMNVLGHLGYEVFPSGFTQHALWGLHNSSTHHNMHHSRVNYNYSLYLNVWDRLMGTNHPAYEETYESVATRRPDFKGRLAILPRPRIVDPELSRKQASL